MLPYLHDQKAKMIEVIELHCPSGHCLAVLFYKPATMSAEEAGVTLAGMCNAKMFSDICPKCGQQATAAMQRKQTYLGKIQQWTDIPGVHVQPDAQAVLVVRAPGGGTRVGTVKTRIVRTSPPSQN